MKMGITILAVLLMLTACGEKDFDSIPAGSQAPFELNSDLDASDNSFPGFNAGVNNGVNTGGPTGGIPNGQTQPDPQQRALCNSNFIVGTVTTSPAGVSREILKAYDDILGQIDIYEAGGRYLTSLQAQGYTVFSLRRDLAKTPEFAALLEKVYFHHLNRRPTSYETSVHFNDLMIEQTNMRRIERELYAKCLRGV